MKVTVGKISKKRTKKYLVILIACLLYMLFVLKMLFDGTNDLKYIFADLFMIAMFMIVIAIFVIPGLALMDFMWEVDEYYFRFVSFERPLDKARLFYAKLLKRNDVQYQMSLKMSQIDFIQVTYYSYPFYSSKYLFGGSGHKVVFKFHMLDGSLYLFENFVGKDKENFYKGIQFMKNCGIQFVDKNKILDAYQANKNMQEYLARIEKEKNHD